ncbi:uncharacterized protein LOC129981176 [Argiope bruennichi]|uniref:Thioredoxin domain-containing protein like n=1 Tax=Argiope bruennichi TaxID=94029 RepID=A0A8T0G579_ARGBR|nr:uncharacterized protein LOC129981176 [Argiope bruennichi]KAF8796393.1 Thioredoxin domain-containing protein like [Argiope bruennichi]
MRLFTTLLYFCIFGTGIILSEETVDEVKEFNKILAEEDGIVVLFTQPCCACTDCVEAEVLTGGMSQQLEDHLGLTVVRIKDPKLKARYGIKKVPALAYIRNNKTALYDGEFEYDTLYLWLQENRQPSTVDLDDTSFEHLTQAATGATTGDWLVIFHNGVCCKKRELIHLENVGIKLRNKVNVASVNTDKAPETADRFKITTCPEIIFFRHQKMYHFTLPEVNVKTLRNFAEGFYKNSKVERVPQPLSAFDKYVERTRDFFSADSYRLIISLYVIFISIAILTIIVVLKMFAAPTKPKSQ